MGAIVFQWCNCRKRSGMTITDLDDGFEAVGVAGGVDPGPWRVARAAAVSARSYSVPVHTINLEFLADQIIGIADDDAVCRGVEIDDITRTWRTAGQPFA